MQDLNHIQNHIYYSSTWSLLFLSISLLGTYVSVLVIASGRIRNQQGVWLGLYTLTVSIVLLSLSAHQFAMPRLVKALHSAGLASMFLMGPFSYHLFLSQRINIRTYSHFIHFLPALAVLVLYSFGSIPLFWIYLGGMVHIGLHLTGQYIRTAFDSWKKGYTLVQVFVYAGISLAFIAFPADIRAIISSLGLALLILLIWIRLLQTAYHSYLSNYS